MVAVKYDGHPVLPAALPLPGLEATPQTLFALPSLTQLLQWIGAFPRNATANMDPKFRVRVASTLPELLRLSDVSTAVLLS